MLTSCKPFKTVTIRYLPIKHLAEIRCNVTFAITKQATIKTEEPKLNIAREQKVMFYSDCDSLAAC